MCYKAVRWNEYVRGQNCVFVMGRGANISREKRAQIVALHQTGFKLRRIARQLQCSKSAVFEAIRRFQETGFNVDRPRSGRPRISTPADDNYLCQTARRRRKVTARSLQGEWFPAIRRHASIQTIRNRLEPPIANVKIRLTSTQSILRY